MFEINTTLPFTPHLLMQECSTSSGSCATAKHIHPDEKALFDNFFDGLAVKLRKAGKAGHY